jgi:iron complex transport system ATP-binding protein
MGIEFKNINLHFGANKILDNVSGAFEKGKINVILGANGAGKSSLLAAIVGLLDNVQGEIKLDGETINKLSPKEKARKIGFLPQKTDIHWDIDVQSVIRLGRMPYQSSFFATNDDAQIIYDAMQQTDCLHLKNRPILELSGGEQSRILLARVLAGTPDWIFADEPLASLDPAHQIDAVEIFKNAANIGKGVVIVLHDLTIASLIADNILILKDGQVLAGGKASETLNIENIASAYGIKAEWLKTKNGRDILVAIEKA